MKSRASEVASEVGPVQKLPRDIIREAQKNKTGPEWAGPRRNQFLSCGLGSMMTQIAVCDSSRMVVCVCVSLKNKHLNNDNE